MKKKVDKRTRMIRLMCIFLCVLMAGGTITSLIYYIIHSLV